SRCLALLRPGQGFPYPHLLTCISLLVAHRSRQRLPCSRSAALCWRDSSAENSHTPTLHAPTLPTPAKPSSPPSSPRWSCGSAPPGNHGSRHSPVSARLCHHSLRR